MKCDIVVYSKTTAIGLFYFSKWDGQIYVMFIYEAETYDGNNSREWRKEILDKILALGETCEENESVVSVILTDSKVYIDTAPFFTF